MKSSLVVCNLLRIKNPDCFNSMFIRHLSLFMWKVSPQRSIEIAQKERDFAAKPADLT